MEGSRAGPGQRRYRHCGVSLGALLSFTPQFLPSMSFDTGMYLVSGSICGFSFLCDYLETRSLYIRNPHFEILGLATPGPPSPNLLQPALPFGRANVDPHGPCAHCTHVPSLPSPEHSPPGHGWQGPVHLSTAGVKSSLPPPQPST